MPIDPENQPSGQDSGFLGGGPKFNQAGLNAPLPGERVADVPPPPPFGGPKVWAGVVVVIVLIVALWMVYGGGYAGTQSKGVRGGISSSDRPSLDPDAPSSQ